MKSIRHLLLFLCFLVVGCGDYWALCIDDAVAAREQDDRVRVDLTLSNCSLGSDRDWPQGKQYCVEALWIGVGEDEEVEAVEACGDNGIPLGTKTELTFISGAVIPPDSGLSIEIEVVGAAAGPHADSTTIESP